MSRPVVGLFTGLIIGLALALGSFGDAVIVAAVGFVGWVAAKMLEGDIDINDYLGGGRDGR